MAAVLWGSSSRIFSETQKRQEQRPKRSQKQNMTMKSMSKLRQPVHPEASVTMYVKTKRCDIK